MQFVIYEFSSGAPSEAPQETFVKCLLYSKNTGRICAGETVLGVPLFSLLSDDSGRESIVPLPPILTRLTPFLDRNTGVEQKGQYKKLTWFSEFRHF